MPIPKKEWFKITNSSEKDTTDIYIFDEIGMWGISAKDFVNAFNSVKTNNINLHINSPGGSVVDGMAIYNTIKNSKKEVTVYIDGYAASSAATIAMSGSILIMPENALFMIHEAMSCACGRAEDLEKEANLLKTINGQIAQIYSDASGKSLDEILSLMKDETWYTGKEALDAGFVDYLGEPLKAVALCDANKFNYKKKDVINKHFSNIKTKPKEFSMPMDLETLKKEEPELYNQIVNKAKKEGSAEGEKAGQEAERKRINSIEALRNSVNGAIIDAAKADSTKTAESVALETVALMNKQLNDPKSKLRNEVNADGKDLADAAAATNAQNGAGAEASEGTLPAEKLENIKRIAGMVNKANRRTQE